MIKIFYNRSDETVKQIPSSLFENVKQDFNFVSETFKQRLSMLQRLLLHCLRKINDPSFALLIQHKMRLEEAFF